MDKFFEGHDLKWSALLANVQTGTPELLVCLCGFHTLMKEKSLNVFSTQCTIYHQALVVETVPDQLKNVLNHEIPAVNFTLLKQVHSIHLFAELCIESDM